MRFGFEAYPWQMSSDTYIGRIDHIVNLVSECEGEGIEPEVCMLGDYAEDPAKLKELLDSRGIRLAAICYVEDWLHEGEADDEAARATRLIDYISRFPGSLLQLCPRSGKDRANLEQRQKNAIRCINDVARRAADMGVVCAVHPNSPRGSVFRTQDDYEILLCGLDSSVVGFVPDTGNIVSGGMDPLDTMRTYRPLVRHMHFKDMSASGECVGLGNGILDFPAIVSYLADTGYQGWVIVDDVSALANSDPDEAARRNAVYVHDKLLPLAREDIRRQ
jgi:inosose dehydratase